MRHGIFYSPIGRLTGSLTNLTQFGLILTYILSLGGDNKRFPQRGMGEIYAQSQI